MSGLGTRSRLSHDTILQNTVFQTIGPHTRMHKNVYVETRILTGRTVARRYCRGWPHHFDISPMERGGSLPDLQSKTPDILSSQRNGRAKTFLDRQQIKEILTLHIAVIPVVNIQCHDNC